MEDEVNTGDFKDVGNLEMNEKLNEITKKKNCV